MVYKKLLLIIILLLNHSLMYGVTSAAHIPDENHPRGYGSHIQNHDHHHHHDHDSDRATPPSAAQTESADELPNQSGHDHHHKHGAHVHLNGELPYSLQFNFGKSGGQEPTNVQFLHQGLSYSPPVPPPNR